MIKVVLHSKMDVEKVTDERLKKKAIYRLNFMQCVQRPSVPSCL